MVSLRCRLLVPLALVVAGCGEVVEPEAFSVTTVAPEPDSGASSVSAPTPGNQTVTTGPPADFFPLRDDTYTPEILVSTRQSVFSAPAVGEAGALEGSFAGTGTTKAFDDLLGGLVVQRGANGGQVIWLSAQGEEPAVLDDAGGQLLDVGYVDGSPVAVVVVEDRLEQIRVIDTERFPLTVLGAEEQVLALSSSGGLHALAVANEHCGELRFLDTAGEPVDLNGPGEPDCPVPRRPVYGAVGLSPDGLDIAYTVVTYRADGTAARTELVARQLSTGTIFFRAKIGDDGDRVSAITFDGDRVAYLSESAGPDTVMLQGLRGKKTAAPVEFPTGVGAIDSISFARLPLADG